MFHRPNNISNKGFTLVELMVVISIIALLSSLILAGFKNARERAVQARAAQTLHAFQVALGLYYNVYGDWPSKAGDGRMYITNKTGQGWPQFYALIKPYIPAGTPDLPYMESSKFIIQGFQYMKGTQTSPVKTQMYDSIDGSYLGCILVYDGYWMEEIFRTQTSLTSKDTGFDPDAVDRYEGNVSLDSSIPTSSCVTSTITF